MAVPLVSTPDSLQDALRLIPMLRDKYLSDKPSIYFLAGDVWPDRQARVLVETKRNFIARAAAAKAELAALGLMWGDTKTKEQWAKNLAESADLLTWTISQNSLPNAIIRTINLSFRPQGSTHDSNYPNPQTRVYLIQAINSAALPPIWQQKFIDLLKGLTEILPSVAGPELAKLDEQIKSVQGKVEQDIASDAFKNLMPPSGGPDVVAPPVTASFAQTWLAKFKDPKNRTWIILGGSALFLGTLSLIALSIKKNNKGLQGVLGAGAKLGTRAKQLLEQLSAGNDRIFYYSDSPPGWAQLEREGLAVREGKDRAKLTHSGQQAAGKGLLGLFGAGKTYVQAKQDIMNYLQSSGWGVKANLKVPYATSPDGYTRIWFKPQGVWFTLGKHHDYKDARTVTYDQDIRKLNGPEFVDWIKRALSNRGGALMGSGQKSKGDKIRATRLRNKMIKAGKLVPGICPVCGEEIEEGHENTPWHIANL